MPASVVSDKPQLPLLLRERLHHEGTQRLGPGGRHEYMIHLNISIPLNTVEYLDTFIERLNDQAKTTRNPERHNRSTIARVAYDLLASTLRELSPLILNPAPSQEEAQ